MVSEVSARLQAFVRRVATAGHAAVWHSHFAVRRVPLDDGSRGNGWLMRRWQDGGWRFRRMTADEEAESVQSETW
ncbi:MAG TPA: hypothetical protein PKA74_19685 [Bauldia sp.]|nr:hypothetical protein [Bauldia sp.]